MELLTIIFDVNPRAWSLRESNLASVRAAAAAANDADDDTANSPVSAPLHTFHQTLNDLLILINAFLLLNTRNQIAIIASHTHTAQFLYPISQSQTQTTDCSQGDQPLASTAPFDNDESLRAPESIHETITRSLQNLLVNHASHTASSHDVMPQSNLAAALSLSLLYANRMMKQYPKMRVRSLVMQVQDNSQAAVAPPRAPATGRPMSSSSLRTQNLALMNCIFSAQKQSHTIDACIFNTSPQSALPSLTATTASGEKAQDTSDLLLSAQRSKCDHLLLQQAAALTGGCYTRPMLHGPQAESLLQTLLTLYLSDASTRQHLVMPHQPAIDYRATCFCHSQTVSEASVCPVCLAIFCRPAHQCPVCSTKFAGVAVPGRTSNASQAQSVSAAAVLRRQQLAAKQRQANANNDNAPPAAASTNSQNNASAAPSANLSAQNSANTTRALTLAPGPTANNAQFSMNATDTSNMVVQ